VTAQQSDLTQSGPHALKRLAALVETIVNPRADNVVPLHANA
jgi:hypothetical protein